MIGATGICTEVYCPWCETYQGWQVGTTFDSVCAHCRQRYRVLDGNECRLTETGAPDLESLLDCWLLGSQRRTTERLEREAALSRGKKKKAASVPPRYS